MTTATPSQPTTAAAPAIRWGRIAVGAVAIEVLLIAVAIPLFALLPNPFIAGAASADGDYTTVFATIAIAAFVCGVLGGLWVVRPLSSGRALHGALAGILATVLYLVICSIPPNTIAAVYATYGPFWFLTANALRIVGAAVAGAWRKS